MNNKLKLTLVLMLVAIVGIGLTACDLADSDEVTSEANIAVANLETVYHFADQGLPLQAYEMEVDLEGAEQATIEVNNARFADTKESSITVKSGETVLFFTQDSLESIKVSGEGLADDVSVGLNPAGEGEAIPLDLDTDAIKGWFVEDDGDWIYYSYNYLFEDFDDLLEFFMEHLMDIWWAHRELEPGEDLAPYEDPYIVSFDNEDGEYASYAQWLAEGEDAYDETTREDFAALIDSEEYYDVETETFAIIKKSLADASATDLEYNRIDQRQTFKVTIVGELTENTFIDVDIDATNIEYPHDVDDLSDYYEVSGADAIVTDSSETEFEIRANEDIASGIELTIVVDGVGAPESAVVSATTWDDEVTVEFARSDVFTSTTAEFTLKYVEAGEADSMTLEPEDLDEIAQGESQEFIIIIEDEYGNPVEGEEVTSEFTGDDEEDTELTPASEETDEYGEVKFTLDVDVGEEVADDKLTITFSHENGLNDIVIDDIDVVFGETATVYDADQLEDALAKDTIDTIILANVGITLDQNEVTHAVDRDLTINFQDNDLTLNDVIEVTEDNTLTLEADEGVKLDGDGEITGDGTLVIGENVEVEVVTSSDIDYESTVKINVDTVYIARENHLRLALDGENVSTIIVADGTTIEPDSTILIDRSGITLKAENKNATIQGSGDLIRIEADDVTIDGFSILEAPNNAYRAGIVPGGQDITIQNNVFEGFNNHIAWDRAGGLDPEDTVIKYNEFRNVGEGNAEKGSAVAQTEGISGIDILENEFYNNRNDIGLAFDATDVTIEGNEFFAEDSVRYISNRNLGDPESEDILALNTFEPEAVIANLDADDREDIVTEPGEGEALNINNRDRFDGTDVIKDAVDGADTDHTILVGPGTYEENVVVNVTGLTLVGQDGAEIESQDVADYEDSEPAVYIMADNVTIDNIDLVEGISPGDNQEVALIDDGVSGTHLMNLAVESPDFTGAETGQGVIGQPLGAAIGDITIENVTAERTIGLVLVNNSEVVIDNVEVTKSAEGAEALWFTGPGFEAADIDLTIEDFTPLQNDAGTGSETDVMMLGEEAEINGVAGDYNVLADAIFDFNADVDQVEIGGEVVTRD